MQTHAFRSFSHLPKRREILNQAITAPAHISVLNDVFAWFLVPSIAVGRFCFIPLVYWTLQNLKDSEKAVNVAPWFNI
jgi:hypothetical protein